jgi:hypothetical protein
MTHKIRLYIATVGLLALGSGAGLYVWHPEVSAEQVVAVLLLSGLAVVAEMLVFLLPRAKGSIAFIPYLASVLIAPGWLAVLAIAGVKALAETLSSARRAFALFNAAQHALTSAVAIAVYRLCGGEGLLAYSTGTIAHLTVEAGLPALAAFCSSFLANGFLVCGLISLRDKKSLSHLWRETVLPTIGVDLLAGPIVFMFAWVYARFGPIAAMSLWFPILGFRQLNKTNIELEQMNTELLQLMVTTLEARDPYTSGHSRRVQSYALLIARAMGLPEREVRRVGQAALLHDVGKIHEKYAPILSKPEQLTEEEWAIMQEHPVDGERLVSTMTRLKELTPAIRHHHEQWDGTGYPDGIAGDQIPVAARIIALADTIDAMTSVRPYRSALTEEQVRAELVRCRGRQFDPALTDQLLSAATWRKLFAPLREPTPKAQPVLSVIGARRRVAG